MKKKIITLALFSHVEAYPPTLNAIRCLASLYDEIIIICSNVLVSDWNYPNNVTLVIVGKPLSIRAFEAKSILFKIVHFLKFTYQIHKHLKLANVFIAYDNIPLLSYKLVSFFRKGRFLWYHNHDVSQKELNRKFSLGWFAVKNEPLMFPKIDLFSLPSIERKQYFPMDKLKGTFSFIPNYPSIYFYSQFNKKPKPEPDPFKIIYQGSIGDGHGIEEIIQILGQQINGKTMHLILKGFITDTYKNELITLAKKHKVLHQLEFYGVTSYKIVPELAATCHVGIAIHTKTDPMNSTLATASNKIYEYAACGLPVLYFNSKHYNQHLSKFTWAFPVLLTPESLQQALTEILNNYTELSYQAIMDFEKELNFETYFKPVEKFLH